MVFFDSADTGVQEGFGGGGVIRGELLHEEVEKKLSPPQQTGACELFQSGVDLVQEGMRTLVTASARLVVGASMPIAPSECVVDM